MTESDLQELPGSLPGGVPAALGEGCRVVVTGCAGFIGSHLTETLLHLGCQVIGVDVLTDYYDPQLKRENIAACLPSSRFTFLEADLLELNAGALLAGAAACFHLAAQAGVRASWGQHFTEYLSCNVLATQRLLEACRRDDVRSSLQRFVYSSSSSIYGDRTDLPVTEAALPQPHSPYGVTKLAGEHLCALYAANWGVPVTSLRYFTVYGPRQRPDMAFRKFLEAALARKPFSVYGDGSQTRDFTYVADAVRANLLALKPTSPYEVLNVGGGTRIALREALDLLRQGLVAELPDLDPAIEYTAAVAGDVRDTYADRSRVEAVIGYRPTLPFPEGLKRELAWVLSRRRLHA